MTKEVAEKHPIKVKKKHKMGGKAEKPTKKK